MLGLNTRVAALVGAASLTLGALGGSAVTGGGDSIGKVKVASGTNSIETQSRSYVDIPGATTTVTVPRGGRALIVARFTASSQCGSLNPDDDGCFVRVLVDGQEADPVNAGHFDTAECCSSSSNGDSWESHAIERSRGPLGPGTYPVRVQWLAGAENLFSLWGWHLTVERVDVG